MSCVSPNKTKFRCHLINLIEQSGHTLGLSKTDIEHLAFLIRLTQDVDWEEGNKAIVYMTVTRTARQLRISERQIHNREQNLCENEKLGIEIKVSGNFRRYGLRNVQTGAITQAFGVDITNLRNCVEKLEKATYEETEEHNQWCDLKQMLSGIKGQIRKVINKARKDKIEACLTPILGQKRLYEGRINSFTTVDEIKRLLMHAETFKKHLEQAITLWKSRGEPDEQYVEISDQSEVHSRHIESSIKSQTTNKLVVEPPTVHEPDLTPYKSRQKQTSTELRVMPPTLTQPKPFLLTQGYSLARQGVVMRAGDFTYEL